MCRLIAYLGQPMPLKNLLLDPDHSLLVQSYRPKELEVALLNADGFGFGWYDGDQPPFTYRHTLPMWNDVNLPHLCRYIRSGCFLANVRSATPGLPLDLSNCQPFVHNNLMFIHNGYIERFRQTLYRPICDRICDDAFQTIYGLTDSEHIFGLLVHQMEIQPGLDLPTALAQTLEILADLAAQHGVRVAANIIVSDGTHLVSARFDNQAQAPSFYWHRQETGVILASEPLFPGDWATYPQSRIMSVGADLDIQTYDLAFDLPQISA